MNFIHSKAAKGAAALSLAMLMALPALTGCSSFKKADAAQTQGESQSQTQETAKSDTSKDTKASKSGKSSKSAGTSKKTTKSTKKSTKKASEKSAPVKSAQKVPAVKGGAAKSAAKR